MKFRQRLIAYYLVVTLVSMTVVGFALIKGIKQAGLHAVEKQLVKQSESAQVYVNQTLYLDQVRSQGLQERTANRITDNLSTGHGEVRIYDRNLLLLSAAEDGVKQDLPKVKGASQELAPALAGNYAYKVQNNSVYFASPIELEGVTYGVLEFIYPLDFLNEILAATTQTLFIGAAAFGLLVLVLSIYIAQKMVRPIKQLVAATEKYAQREFVTIHPQSSDELGQLSRSFNQMGNQLQAYIQNQKQFVSNVSHELRTPLTAIKGYSEYLAEEIPDRADLKKAVFHLNHESERLTKLVNELLLLSKLESQTSEFSFTKIDFTELVQAVIKGMELRAEKNQITLKQVLATQIVITGDGEKLHQALINVLDNAIKYSSIGSSVEVELQQDGEFALLSISDRGVGIPPEDQERIFQRFYRAANTKAVVGTGLGLAITQEIVWGHRGEITVSSRSGGGTVVRFKLPLIN